MVGVVEACALICRRCLSNLIDAPSGATSLFRLDPQACTLARTLQNQPLESQPLHARRHSSAINFLGPTTRSGLLAAAGATCDDDTPRAAGPTARRRLFCPPLHLGVQPPRPPARVRGRACRRRLLRCWRKAPLSRHVTQKRGPRSWPEGRKSLHSCVTNCGDDIRLIAFFTDLGPIRKILMHLGEPLESPPLSPAHRAAVSGGVKVAVLTDVR